MTTKYPIELIKPSGTAGQVLTSNGVGSSPTFQAATGGGGGLTLGTPVTVTSNTTIINGIPTGTKHLVVTYDMHALSFLYLLLGDANGFVGSGYLSAMTIRVASFTSFVTSSTRFNLGDSANESKSGSVHLDLLNPNSNLWLMQGTGIKSSFSSTSGSTLSSGRKSLASELTQIAIAGGNASGEINIAYE